MVGLRLGPAAVSALRLGSANVSKAYVGSTLVWPVAIETFPSIVTTNTEIGTSLGSNNPIPAPSGVVAGNLLIAVGLNDNPSTTNLSASTGWTQVIAATHTLSTAIKMAVFARVADGSASDALSLSGASQDYCAAIARITDHSVSNVAADIKSASAQSTVGGTNLNPPSLDAGASRKWLWLAAAGVDTTAGNISWTSMPTGYTQTVTPLQSANTASSCSMGMASRQLETQTEDPVNFVISQSLHWLALTLAIPPAPA